MHRLLKGQLQRLNLDQNNPPDLETWQEILDQINTTYKETDRDRNLLEYSLTMSSREMQELYDDLKQSAAKHIAQLVSTNEKLLAEIVERERAEEALRKSKEKYQTITNQLPIGVYRSTEDGQIIHANPALAAMLDYNSIEELMPVPASEIYLDPQERLLQLQELANAGSITSKEIKLQTKKGREIWVRDTARIILDEYNQIHYIDGTVEDITADKLAEEALQNRIEFEELVAAISTKFIAADTQDMDAQIDQTLQIIGQVTAVDRTYVFLFRRRGVTDNTHEWCAPGIETRIEALQTLLTKDFPWLAEKFNHLKIANIPRVVDLPPEANAEKQILQRQGVKSMLAVPMVQDGLAIGLVGVDSVRTERAWTEEIIALLNVVSNIFAQAIESKRAQQALNRQHAFLQQIIDINPHFIFAKDQQGRFTLANQAFATAYHTTVAELMGKTDAHFNPNQDMIDKYLHDDLFVLKTGQEINIPEEEVTNVIGQKKWRHTIKRPILDENGNVQQVLGVITNITERKLAEQEIIRFTNHLRIAADVSKQISAILDPDHLIEMIVTQLQTHFDLYYIHIYLLNEKFNMLIMQAGSGEIGQRLRQQTHRIPLASEQSLVAWAARNQELVWVNDVDSETKFLPNPLLPETKAEIAIPLIVSGKVLGVLDIQDNHPNRFTRIDLDTFSTLTGQIAITLENAHLFKAQKRTAEGLRRSEAKNRALLDAIPDIMLQLRKDGTFVDFRLPKGIVSHLTPDEFLNKNIDDVLPPQVTKELRLGLEQTIHSAEMQVYEYQIPTENGLQDFEARMVVSGEDEIFVIIRDITKRKEAEKALARVRDQALEASRLKSELLAKVSHELRTPLNAILGFTEMLEFGIYGNLTAEQKDVAVEIIASTKYLADLVNELLDQAQLEAGKLKFDLSHFAPAELVEQIQARMNVLAQNKGLELTTDISFDIPTMLYNDPARLQQILVNLVGNAIKFTETGSVNLRLYCPNPTHWAIQVSDTGAGIPPEAQSYIFEPFRQLDDSQTRKYGGSGLGLSIVQQLVTLMGGYIMLSSEVGQGSTFTVILPMQSPQEKTDD